MVAFYQKQFYVPWQGKLCKKLIMLTKSLNMQSLKQFFISDGAGGGELKPFLVYKILQSLTRN